MEDKVIAKRSFGETGLGRSQGKVKGYSELTVLVQWRNGEEASVRGAE